MGGKDADTGLRGAVAGAAGVAVLGLLAWPVGAPIASSTEVLDRSGIVPPATSSPTSGSSARELRAAEASPRQLRAAEPSLRELRAGELSARERPVAPDDGLPSGPAFPLETRDPELQRRLVEAIGKAGGDELARRGRLSVALVDLDAGDEPLYAGVNDRRMVYAASLPKIAALLASFQMIEEGRLRETPELRQDLASMIRHSSNAAASRVIRRVGFGEIARCLRDPRYRLYRPPEGGLWVGKSYDGTPAWNRDPLHGLSHGATAHQVARFFTLLDRGRLVSPEKSREMKRILSRPAIRHKFVAGLADRPDVRIYRKSGTWREWHADGALVEHGARRYVAVGLVRSPKGGELLARLIRELDEAAMGPGGDASAGTSGARDS